MTTHLTKKLGLIATVSLLALSSTATYGMGERANRDNAAVRSGGANDMNPQTGGSSVTSNSITGRRTVDDMGTTTTRRGNTRYNDPSQASGDIEEETPNTMDDRILRSQPGPMGTDRYTGTGSPAEGRSTGSRSSTGGATGGSTSGGGGGM